MRAAALAPASNAGGLALLSSSLILRSMLSLCIGGQTELDVVSKNSMRVSRLLALLLAAIGCSDVSNNQSTITIKTPDGNVVANKSTVDPVSQKITAVTGDELKGLQTLTQDAPTFVAAYLPQTPDPDLKDCDLAFRAWQISDNKQHSSQQVVEILGGYLGNKCVADFDMEWVTVTDEYGTDYAVRSKTVDVMAFPFSTVLKRIENNEHDFLYAVYYAIKQTLESGDYMRRDPESSSK
jgi:hypothetical protein